MLIFALTLGTVHLVAAEVDLSDLLQVAGDIEENSQISEMEDLRSHIDTDDFKRQVGASLDEFFEHVRSMDGNDLQALMNEDDSTEDVEQLLAGAQKGKFFKKILDVGKKAVETVKESVKTVVTKGIDYFKNKATEWAKGMLNKVKERASWKPEEYWKFMTRIPKDFTGAHLDTNDDYVAFNRHADPATQRLFKNAFGSIPHQDKCKKKGSDWNEWHPTPFSEIAKQPNSPFKVYPFKAQYENDPTGYFLEPCNGVSNGYFFASFGDAAVASKGNCGSDAGYAMDCIDEDHLLQVVLAMTGWGSWFFHGSGGMPMGGYMDTGGMDIEFYFMFRLVLKSFVHDVEARKKLVLTHACNKDTVPDESDGIKWLDSNGERNCHLYWARQFKKMMANSTLIADGAHARSVSYSKSLVPGLPDMAESIAAMVFLTLRAVFHKKFPAGTMIFEQVSTKVVDALMAKAPQAHRDAQKVWAKTLHEDKVLGFENPHDGLVHVLNILTDFMDAMFFQESGKFGPGTKGLTKVISPQAGCTIQPHATWHRKSSRVVLGFVKMGKTLSQKLKKPEAMNSLNLYKSLVLGVPGLITTLKETFNMVRLAKSDASPLNVKGFIGYIESKFGNGWPKSFGGDKWPKCACLHDYAKMFNGKDYRCGDNLIWPKNKTCPPSTVPTPSAPSVPSTPSTLSTPSVPLVPSTPSTPTESGVVGDKIKAEAAQHSKAAEKAAADAQTYANAAKKAAADAAAIASKLKKLGD